MSTEDDDGPTGTPPADWQTITPDRSWAEVTRHRGAARMARAEAKAAGERLAAAEAKVAELSTAAGRVSELEAQLARTSTRLGMARAGVVDDDLADVAEQRHTRYATAAGKDALGLSEWLSGPAKEDPIMGRLLGQVAAPPTPAAPPPATKAPMLPSPTPTPTATQATSAEDVARLRAANGGRIPSAMQASMGTLINPSDLLRR
jgi:hypothetical protein